MSKPLEIRDLEPEERAALARFAKAHGRKWKVELRCTYWYNARPWRGPGDVEGDGGILHGLRNDPRWNHRGLDKVVTRKLLKEA